MSAEKVILSDVIGIVAGGGELPEILYNHCKSKNQKVKIAALKNYCDSSSNRFDEEDIKLFKIGQVGKILKYFKRNNIENIILIGRVSRPNLYTILPDAKGWKLIFKLLKIYRKGDNKLFSVITEFIEKQGLNLLGVHEVFPELLAGEGLLGQVKPGKDYMEDIKFGFEKAKEVGLQDTGQAIIVKNRKLLAKESVEGTNFMIKKFANGDSYQKGAILVKVKKPNQNGKIDLPTIGKETVKLCSDAKISGIVLESDHSLIANKEDTIKTADDKAIFVYGYSI